MYVQLLISDNPSCLLKEHVLAMGHYLFNLIAMSQGDVGPPKKMLKGNSDSTKKSKDGGKSRGTLTVEQLEADEVSQLAAQHWRGDKVKPFSPQVLFIRFIYSSWV